MASIASVASLLAPLDTARRAVLRPLAPRLGRWFRDRALRVSIAGTLSVMVSLALTAVAPLWLMAFGPVILGVTHLAADARYLIVRQGLQRRAPVIALVVAPALLASWRPNLAWVFAPVLGATLCARGPWITRVAFALSAATLYALAKDHERLAWIAVAHGHHVVALTAWWWWCRRPWGARTAVLAAVVAGFVAIFSGALDELALRPWALRPPGDGLEMGALVATLSPVDPSQDPLRAMRWVLAFAFGQSVHYALWLRLIPEEDRARPAPRTFVGSTIALARDLGAAITLAIALATLALVAWAMRDVSAARGAYLRVAAGHGGLELGALSLLACERSLRREAGPFTSRRR